MSVPTIYTTDLANGNRPIRAEATIDIVGIGAGGTSASVVNGNVHGHMGNAHPYHHERGHLIGRQLGGDGSTPNNLVGLSDGTNAPLMSDIEGLCRDIIEANDVGASVFLQVDVDWSGADYSGTAAAVYVAGMVSSIHVKIYTNAGGDLLFQQKYPNGVVKDHHVAGCC